MTQSTDLHRMEERYARQMLLAELGPEGQAALARGAVLVLGCGALGSNLASLLARAGVGRLRIVDRDILEASNLPRQVLFDEDDVTATLPKAEAAARKLRRINSACEIEPLVSDATTRTIEGLLAGMDLAVDGTDNLETRYLLNDACVKHGVPWVYGGVLGTTGMTMTIVPSAGPCLRCLFPTPPPPGTLPTCETQGVLGTLPAAIAALQATEAIKLLAGGERSPHLVSLNLWQPAIQQVAVLRDEACPCCVEGRFDFLESRETAWVTSFCGRNAIQIAPAAESHLDLERLSRELAAVGEVTYNGLLLQFIPEGGEHELIFFPDGRMMVKGTTDQALARSLYARYLGG